MSYIIENKSGRFTYLYECTSKRENGKVVGKRKIIGKIDPTTGERRYKAEFIERMRLAGTPIKISTTEKLFSINDVKKSSLLEYGMFHLLRTLAERSGLANALAISLNGYWQEVFMLAAHLVSTGEPFMHCDEWLSETESYPVGSMSSQRISELLASISAEHRGMFYRAWCERRLEDEYLALDITSSSSYSDLIEDVEWGYNRDGEELPQVNICLLMGEKSRLPVYQTVYAGSLKDVSTLNTTIAKFDHITGGKPVLVVMDKGFYSKRNVDAMLSSDGLKKFILSIPFTSSFAKKQVYEERKDIDSISNTIVLGGDTMRAVTKERTWGTGHKVFTHIYYSPGKASGRREDIYGHVAILRDEALDNPDKYKESEEHAKYLNIRKSGISESGYTVTAKEDAVNNAIGTAGWLVIISNDISDAKEAIRIYRAKDIVEKGFLKLKTSLDLGRLRVHNQERMQNKVFIGFVALVLMSEIHSVMTDKGLYAKLTMRQLIRTLAKQRVQNIGDNRIIYPATKAQRDIYKAFNVDVPV